MKQIAVIGSGTMGNGIAHTFAQFNYQVNLIDINQAALDRAIQTITKNLDRQVAKGALTEDQKSAALNNITTYTSTKDGVRSADLIVEAATEHVDLKLKIFKDLDKYNAVTAEQIKDVANKYLNQTQRSIVSLEPKGKKEE